MVKDKMKEMIESWDNTTRLIIESEVDFIEKNKEKLSLCTKRGERGVWIIFIRQEDTDSIFEQIKRKKTNIFFEEKIGKKHTFPCVFNTIESINKESLPQDIYKKIETYNPIKEILVMFYLEEGLNKQQCYTVPRTDIN